MRPSQPPPAEILDRTPPHSIDAERSVIGACILFPDLLHDLQDILRPTDFYADAHRILFVVLLDLFRESVVDETTLVTALRDTGQLDLIGGQAYLFEILESQATPGTAKDLAGHIRDQSNIRRTIHAATEILQSCYQPGRPVDILAGVHRTLAAAVDGLATVSRRRRNLSLQDCCLEHLQWHIDAKSRGDQPRYSTGIRDLDDATGGIEMGEFVVFGGRPSQGKTAIGLQVLDALSQQGLRTAFVSEEMTQAKIGARAMKRITALPEEQWADHSDEVAEAIRNHCHERTMIVTSSFGRTSMVISEIERLHRTSGLQAVCVDYVQLLRGKGEDEYTQVTDTIRELKAVTTRLGIITLALGQLNREKSKRPDPTPRLTDLKGSGQWEQDADLALLLHWPWYENNDHEPMGDYRVIQAKNRNRGIKKYCIKLRYDPERQTIMDEPKCSEFNAEDYNDLFPE